jgi:ABC-type Fe3+ transport system substrate-binding protein
MRCNIRAAMAALLAVLVLPVCALAGETVRVMTSYPPEMTERYQKAFTQRHPDIAVDFEIGHGAEAIATLRAPDQGGVDVLWSPALKAFPLLSRNGAFRPLGDVAKGVADRVAGMPLTDGSGRYAAFELAGYGLVIRPDYLEKHGLPTPRDWADLAQPAFAGHVIVPIPSVIGYAPPMIEVIVQQHGWAKGWALLAEIAANAELLENGGGGAVVGEVADGHQGVGMVIDFFVRSAKAEGKPVAFVYPEVTGYVPAHVAITAKAPHPAAAEAFVRFVLSDEGQALLTAPEVVRLPVRPSAYAKAPAGYPRPFEGKAAAFTFDSAKGTARQSAMVALFDAFLTNRQAELRALFAEIRKAEAAGDLARAEAARRLVTTVPATESEIGDPAVNTVLETPDGDPARVIKARWAKAIAESTRQARAALAR